LVGRKGIRYGPRGGSMLEVISVCNYGVWIVATLSHQLPWFHFIEIVKFEDSVSHSVSN
jgi:hypothetical protein